MAVLAAMTSSTIVSTSATDLVQRAKREAPADGSLWRNMLMGGSLAPTITSAFASAGAPHRDAVDAQGRLADANRHALTILPAGTDTVVEGEVVADHGDAM